MADVLLRFSTPTQPWSINMERTKHWSWRSKRVKAWRLRAFYEARVLGLGPMPPSIVTVSLPFDKAARRDPSNYLPAVKAIVDGLVDAELWPDDTPEYVSVAEPILTVGGQVEVRITVQ